MPRKLAGALLTLLTVPGILSAGETWMLEVKKAQRIEAVMSYEYATSDFKAESWLIFLAKPPELPSQINVSSSVRPAAEEARELSPLKRKVFALRIPVLSPEQQRTIRFTMKLEATLMSRRLVHVAEPASRPAVPPLSPADRQRALAPTDSLNFHDKAFQRWLQENNLTRREGELEVDFALRVLEVIHSDFTYAYFEHDRKASLVCGTKRTDCGGMSAAFVSALRANGIPARALYGRMARSGNPKAEPSALERWQGHARAEFFAEGIGWVPVEPTQANIDKNRPVRHYLGNDAGDQFVLHVDPDMELQYPLSPKHDKILLQQFHLYAKGSGPFTGKLGSDLQVRVLPMEEHVAQRKAPEAEARKTAEARKAQEMAQTNALEQKQQERATAYLRYAKSLVKNGELAKARQRLQEIVTDFPKTQAAHEAQELLDKVRPAAPSRDTDR